MSRNYFIYKVRRYCDENADIVLIIFVIVWSLTIAMIVLAGEGSLSVKCIFQTPYLALISLRAFFCLDYSPDFLKCPQRPDTFPDTRKPYKDII